jgi:hypothetical protein
MPPTAVATVAAGPAPSAASLPPLLLPVLAWSAPSWPEDSDSW